MAKTKTMVLVFGFSFPFLLGFQGKSGFSFGKSGFSFWFQFCPREGVGVFSPPLNLECFEGSSSFGGRSCKTLPLQFCPLSLCGLKHSVPKSPVHNRIAGPRKADKMTPMSQGNYPQLSKPKCHMSRKRFGAYQVSCPRSKEPSRYLCLVGTSSHTGGAKFGI